MKNLIYSSLLCCLFFSSCAKKSANSDVLKVGMELAYPPFEMKDADGKPAGISVELAEAIGKYVGKKVVVENIAWAGLIPSLLTGKIDMIISSMTITDKRKEQVNFSDPYSFTKLALLVNKNSPIQTASDINKPSVKLALKQGTTGYIYAQNNFSNAQINSFVDNNSILTEVIQNKADGLIYDQLTIYNYYKDNPTTTRIVPLNVKPEDIDYWGIAVSKKNPELLKQVNSFLAEYKKQDKLKEVATKYLDIDQNDFTSYGLDPLF